jgi:hypothetical protein
MKSPGDTPRSTILRTLAETNPSPAYLIEPRRRIAAAMSYFVIDPISSRIRASAEMIAGGAVA